MMTVWIYSFCATFGRIMDGLARAWAASSYRAPRTPCNGDVAFGTKLLSRQRPLYGLWYRTPCGYLSTHLGKCGARSSVDSRSYHTLQSGPWSSGPACFKRKFQDRLYPCLEDMLCFYRVHVACSMAALAKCAVVHFFPVSVSTGIWPHWVMSLWAHRLNR